MGRRATEKKRKKPNAKVDIWLAELLIKLQYQDLSTLTIDDIAYLAQKSKSTIYEYFGSKEEIVLAACQTRIKYLTESVMSQMPSDGDPLTQYQYLMESFTEGISDITSSFLRDIQNYYFEAWKAVNEFTEIFILTIKSIYKAGMKAGLFNKVSLELMINLDKYFVTSMVTDPSILNDASSTVGDLSREYLKLRLGGLLKK